jgi:hypothetical protein
VWVAAVTGLILVASLSVTAIAGSGVPTKGPIPQQAFQPGGRIDRSLVPDYVPVGGPEGGIVGYVTRDAALDPPPIGGDAVSNVPVFGEDLTELVGHMVDGRGFVPLAH